MFQKSNWHKKEFRTKVYDENRNWRMKFWEAMKSDDDETLKELFPTNESIRNKAKDIWSPYNEKRRNLETTCGCDLLDVVSSIRAHINGRKPALKCLNWLMSKKEFSDEEIQWIIKRNKVEIERNETKREDYTTINNILCA